VVFNKLDWSHCIVKTYLCTSPELYHCFSSSRNCSGWCCYTGCKCY